VRLSRPLEARKQQTTNVKKPHKSEVDVGMDKQVNQEYELFRLAIVERDEAAWAALHTRYRALLITWACRCGAWTRAGEAAADIADQAFGRAWAALTPDRFAAFSSVGQLLGYLRACVTTTVIDNARAQASTERILPPARANATTTPEQIVLADLGRDELWQRVIELAMTPAERIVLVETFACDLPPRTIHARHPRVFADVASVYRAKRNILARLRHNQDLRHLYDAPVLV
jgi:DNA-directed RNA polymerase specialized sigma24 family protein